MAKVDASPPPIHDIDIRQLRLFKTVVECDGLTAAEYQLGMSCSTISKHLSALEERLTVRLCERGRSGFSVTAQGLAVYNATISLLDALETFRSELSSTKKLLTGSVSLWVMDNSHNEHGNPLARMLARFKSRPGNVKVTINATDPGSVESAVAAGLAQIGITISDNRMPSLNYEPIGEETTSLYCATNHPRVESLVGGSVSNARFDGLNFITRGYLRSDPFARRHPWKSTAVAQHIEGTLQLILSGSFIGIIPDHIAALWVANNRIRRINWAETTGVAKINVVWRQKSGSNLTVTSMLDDIRSVYRDASA